MPTYKGPMSSDHWTQMFLSMQLRPGCIWRTFWDKISLLGPPPGWWKLHRSDATSWTKMGPSLDVKKAVMFKDVWSVYRMSKKLNRVYNGNSNYSLIVYIYIYSVSEVIKSFGHVGPWFFTPFLALHTAGATVAVDEPQRQRPNLRRGCRSDHEPKHHRSKMV